MMQQEQQLRNLRDFLMVYNRMTETCFQRCTSNFNYRNLTMEEERCLDSCAGKLIRTNHRLMGTYVDLMPKMVHVAAFSPPGVPIVRLPQCWCAPSSKSALTPHQ
uniref:Mitochondrial import inner membrane translocase subunit n=1 Tax=Cynoglossus semilaevis TaxID=244447 RepID=A0A3P8VID8_CYNSE